MKLKEYFNKLGLLFNVVLFASSLVFCRSNKNKSESEEGKQQPMHNGNRVHNNPQPQGSHNLNLNEPQYHNNCEPENSKQQSIHNGNRVHNNPEPQGPQPRGSQNLNLNEPQYHSNNPDEFDNSVDNDTIYFNSIEKLKSLIEDFKINKNKAAFLQGFDKLNLDIKITNFIKDNYDIYFKKLPFLEEINKAIFSKIVTTPIFGTHLRWLVLDFRLSESFRIGKIQNKINEIEKSIPIRPILTLEKSENLLKELKLLEFLLGGDIDMDCAKRDHINIISDKIRNCRDKEINSFQKQLDEIRVDRYDIPSIDIDLKKVNEIQIKADGNNKISEIDKETFKKYCNEKKNELLRQKQITLLIKDYWINLNRLLLSPYSWYDFCGDELFLGEYMFKIEKTRDLNNKNEYIAIINKFKEIHDKIINNKYSDSRLENILREHDKTIEYLNKKIQELN